MITDANSTGLAPGGTELAEMTAQINTAPTPRGVDPGVYEELKAELIRVLMEVAGKSASIPPTGELNQVTDLLLMGNDTDGYRLE